MAIQKNIAITLAGIVAIAAIIFVYVDNQKNNTKYDAFAKCLTDKGVKLYGAFWCPHCITQKELFGGSVKYLNYIECSTPDGKSQTEICSKEGIENYPTWQYADGKRESAVKSLAELSKISGCAL